MSRWPWLDRVCLGAFLFWSAAGLIFTLFPVTPDDVARWPITIWLQGFVDGCLIWGDPLLILLAFTNSHLHAVRQWNPAVARRWAITVLLVTYAVETLGVSTGFPFGAYHYTDRFGPLLGLVPITIPLSWHILVTNALFIVRAVAPYLSVWREALLVGLLGTGYDYALEPFATRVKGYWHWLPWDHVPLTNYLSWFVIAVLLVRLAAPTLAARRPGDLRPWLVLGLTLLIFISGQI